MVDSKDLEKALLAERLILTAAERSEDIDEEVLNSIALSIKPAEDSVNDPLEKVSALVFQLLLNACGRDN